MAKRESGAITLLLVDDHEIVRMGLRALFERMQDFEVVGEAGSATGAIAEAGRLQPDVVLMDVRLPDGSGVDACREILAARPDAGVLFLTSYEDEDAMLAAVFAGARGYMLKEIDGDALVDAARTVAAGRSILDRNMMNSVVTSMRFLAEPGAPASGDLLSPQERRVLALVAEGKTNKEIATALKLSDKTVKNYLGNVFQKLRVHRRSQAAAIYSRRATQ